MGLTKTEIRNLDLSYYGIVKYYKDYNSVDILLPLETLNFAIELCLFDDEDLDEPDESRTLAGNGITKKLYHKNLAAVHTCTRSIDDSFYFVIGVNKIVYDDLGLKENDYVKIIPEIIVGNQVLWLEKLKISEKLVSKFLVQITGYTAITNIYFVNIPIPNEIAKVHNITTNTIFKISEILCMVEKNTKTNNNKSNKYFIKIPKNILIDKNLINEENLIVILTNKTIEIGKTK